MTVHSLFMVQLVVTVPPILLPLDMHMVYDPTYLVIQSNGICFWFVKVAPEIRKTKFEQ
jgi:hypothetical protein